LTSYTQFGLLYTAGEQTFELSTVVL